MIQTFYLIVFLIFTCSFGFAVSRFILKEKRLFALVPFSIILGVNAYVFFLNAFSYLIPIQYSVWVVLALLALAALGIFYKNREALSTKSLCEDPLGKKKNRLLWGIALAISLLTGLVALKSLALDDLFIGHIPLAVTIAEGNFPVVDPSAPHHILAYHYGSDMLSAALRLIAGIPVWLGYDVQTFLFSGSFFLLLFVFLFDVTKKFRTAAIGAGLFIFGAGLQWIHFFTKGIPAFWQRFVQDQDVPGFWSFLTHVAFPKLNTSYVHTMHNHSTAIGMPILFFVLLLYFRSLYTESKKEWLTYSIIGGVLFGYLALNLETYYVITFLGFISMLGIYFIQKKWNYFGQVFSTVTAPRFVSTTFIIMILGLVIALVQGGVLASMFLGTDRDSFALVSSVGDFMTMNFAPNPEKVDNSSTYIYLFSFEFFVQFGLPLLLIIPAVVYFWRKREGKFLHLFIIGLGAFLIPFLFRLPTRPWEVSRFFVLGMPMFSLLVGVFLSEMYERFAERGQVIKKRLVVAAIILVGATAVLSQMIFALTSMDRFGAVKPFIGKPPEASPIDAKAHIWIRQTTTLEDRFFPYDPHFIRHTGRYTPGVYPYFTFSLRTKEKAMYTSILKECSVEAIKEFRINYLYVSPDFPIKDYKKCAAKLGAKEVYSDYGADGFRLIYKIE